VISWEGIRLANEGQPVTQLNPGQPRASCRIVPSDYPIVRAWTSPLGGCGADADNRAMKSADEEARASLEHLAAAMQRVERVLRRRPGAGMERDSAASARWAGGTRVVCGDAGGTRIETDMPPEIGGTGDRVSPGWLLRAGLASCAATRIVMACAAEGVTLTSLEVVAQSRSDARGLLGMTDETGAAFGPGPIDVQLNVVISTADAAREQVLALVERAVACSPVTSALQDTVPVNVRITADSA
jgi:uncharacterized OsmC-like protein